MVNLTSTVEVEKDGFNVRVAWDGATKTVQEEKVHVDFSVTFVVK